MTDEPRKDSLLVIFLTVFIDLLGFGLVLPLLPAYADHYLTESANAGMQLGLLMASFSAMQFLFAPFWGVIRQHGRRPIIMVGLAGSVVFYSLFGLATTELISDPSTTMLLLYVSRIGAGIFELPFLPLRHTLPIQRHLKASEVNGVNDGLGAGSPSACSWECSHG